MCIFLNHNKFVMHLFTYISLFPGSSIWSKETDQHSPWFQKKNTLNKNPAGHLRSKQATIESYGPTNAKWCAGRSLFKGEHKGL